MAGSIGRTPESLKASGRSSENLSLPMLQGQIKRDPEGYETEIHLIYKQFKASVDLFQQQAALTFSSASSDTSVAKDLGDRAMFLAHVTPFYPKLLAPFPAQLTDLLRTSCLAMPSGLRNHVAQALILLMNRKAIAVGLNVVREMCIRIHELMTEELLQDFALYRKDHAHDKAISAASRSLIALFREINPSLLVKKDRGRPGGPIARPKQYGEVTVFSNVPNVALLQESDNEEDDDDVALPASDDDIEQELTPDECGTEDEAEEDSDDADDMNNSEDDSDMDALVSGDEEEEKIDSDEAETGSEDDGEASDSSVEGSGNKERAKGKKRKIVDFDASLLAADTSLRALKRCAEAKRSSAESDGILSNEDFRKIKELQAKKDVKLALARKGFKVPDSDRLSKKLVDPAKLEAHIRHKLTKEERLELVKAGREDRGKYQSKTAIKQKKTGGSSNRQKEHKKNMPLAAIRSKAVKSKRAKKMKSSLSGSQFRGRKAWK